MHFNLLYSLGIEDYSKSAGWEKHRFGGPRTKKRKQATSSTRK